MGFDIIRAAKSVLATHPDDKLETLFTPWGESLIEDGNLNSGQVLQEYPRPAFKRRSYINLNGWWECAFRPLDRDTRLTPPESFDEAILVPFSPEAPLSGVNRKLLKDEVLWYKRRFDAKHSPNHRWLLNFEAVDHECDCWVDGVHVGHHEGGYTPFTFDITSAIESSEDAVHELILAVIDPTESDVQPRGKQRIDRGSIWYTAQSGIWQTVWLEQVPNRYLSDVEINPNMDDKTLSLILHTKDFSPYSSFVNISATAYDGSSKRTAVSCVESSDESVALEIEFDKIHPWSPDDPYLYNLHIQYGNDDIESYFAFRTCMVEKDEFGHAVFCLNHEPYFLRGLLDQGYWPDGLMTAPSDDALIFDIEFAKEMNFNMLRKHIKVESRRWYYHCDVLGMIVCQDMINGGGDYSPFHTNEFPTLFPTIAANFDDRHSQKRFGSDSARYQALWLKNAVSTINDLRNHPCICTWVIFNEGWGQFDAQEITAHLRAIDDSRPFDQASGWFDQGGGDYVSEHNYFRDLKVPKNNRAGVKIDRAKIISEFGGAALHIPEHSSLTRAYGYDICKNANIYEQKVRSLLKQANSLASDGLSGYVYTQLSDIEEEVNGLITYDRKVKKLEDPIA